MKTLKRIMAVLLLAFIVLGLSYLVYTATAVGGSL